MMFNKEYDSKDIDKILNSMVILIDTQEKVYSHISMWLKSNKIKYESYNLDFGDYSFYVPKNEKLGIMENIYFDKDIAIERKANATEISGNFTQGRERFKREFERSNKNMRLLIEDSSYRNMCEGEYNTKANSESLISSLHSFQERYNSPFFFCDKSHSGKYIYNTFYWYLKNKLKEL